MLRSHIKARKKRVATHLAVLQKPKADVISLVSLIQAELEWLVWLQKSLNAKLNPTTESALIAKLAKRRGKKRPGRVAVTAIPDCALCQHPRAKHDRYGCQFHAVEGRFISGCACSEYRAPEEQ
jgi:hypothetical protein